MNIVVDRETFEDEVRRVVVDSAGTVIDLGRRRRLFTGSSREAAMLQACLRSPGGLRCFWPSCDGHDRCLQADHREPAAAAAGGPTDVANSDIYCGFHNRLKERWFRPVRHADGTWAMYRPDGTPVAAAPALASVPCRVRTSQHERIVVPAGSFRFPPSRKPSPLAGEHGRGVTHDGSDVRFEMASTSSSTLGAPSNPAAVA